MNTDRTPLTENLPFDLAEVKQFLRVDFNDDDASVSAIASAAALEIEAGGEVALLAQAITHTVTAWGATIDLPVGPLWAAGLGDNPVTVDTRDADGTLTPMSGGWWIEGTKQLRLRLSETIRAEALVITYPAGFGETAATIPADLAHAISDHASRLYDMRGDAEAGSALLSPAARRTVARYRRVKA